MSSTSPPRLAPTGKSTICHLAASSAARVSESGPAFGDKDTSTRAPLPANRKGTWPTNLWELNYWPDSACSSFTLLPCDDRLLPHRTWQPSRGPYRCDAVFITKVRTDVYEHRCACCSFRIIISHICDCFFFFWQKDLLHPKQEHAFLEVSRSVVVLAKLTHGDDLLMMGDLIHRLFSYSFQSHLSLQVVIKIHQAQRAVAHTSYHANSDRETIASNLFSTPFRNHRSLKPASKANRS